MVSSYVSRPRIYVHHRCVTNTLAKWSPLFVETTRTLKSPVAPGVAAPKWTISGDSRDGSLTGFITLRTM
ncbi:hypothetical protein Q1695_012376 [Nippostrongylus brasiliensis]|nr:hypothetical protein Q1695_012376 [Nippostrongylus brasiliensis]